MDNPETTVTPREVIMRAIATCLSDMVIEGYGPLCVRIERALDEAGFMIVRKPLA